MISGSFKLTLIVVPVLLADILLCLFLPFVLPRYSTSLHYYPPYDHIVAPDIAASYCPCLHKYVPKFRNKTLVRMGRDLNDPMELRTIKHFPYVASVHNESTKTFLCEGAVTEDLMIVTSKYCASHHNQMIGLVVRAQSAFNHKKGTLHRVITSAIDHYLYILRVGPPLPEELRDFGVIVDFTNPPPDPESYVVHYWESRYTQIEFQTDYFLRRVTCNYGKTFWCKDEPYPISPLMVITLCRPQVIGLAPKQGDVWHHYEQCEPMYIGSCNFGDDDLFCAEETTTYPSTTRRKNQ